MSKLKVAQELIDIFYPIGSIYQSTNATSPEKLFGGKWTQVTDRFLYNTTTSKTTGGSTTTGSWNGTSGGTKLTESNLPSRAMVRQSVSGTKYGCNCNTGITNTWANICLNDGGFTSGVAHSHSLPSHTHSQNLPPYFTVYCWYRVS